MLLSIDCIIYASRYYHNIINMYLSPSLSDWFGRSSEQMQYLHEKVQEFDLNADAAPQKGKGRSFALLGYSEDEGVKRNLGRVGAKEAPWAIRHVLGGMANHLAKKDLLFDTGTVECEGEDMEGAHKEVAARVEDLLTKGLKPILLGGGHDLAYAHFSGIRNFLENKEQAKTIGIINLDAHFDLREYEEEGHSGSPFRQIAKLVGTHDFEYFCLGIQRSANIPELFKTADELGVQYLLNTEFQLDSWNLVKGRLEHFIERVDHVYLTVDMDGFHSGIAPGVSAPSPQGFSWEVARRTIEHIAASTKLISMDVVELNPQLDNDSVTAKLTAAAIYEAMTSWV